MTTIYIVLRHAYDSDTELYSVDIAGAYMNLHDAETHIAKCADSSDVYEIRVVISETARSRSESRQDESSRS